MNQRCDIDDVVFSVAGLFQDFPELLEGFGSFLPPRSMLRGVTGLELCVDSAENNRVSLRVGSYLELRGEYQSTEEALRQRPGAMQLANAERSGASLPGIIWTIIMSTAKTCYAPGSLDIVETCLPGLQTGFTDIFQAYCSYS